MNKIFYVKKTHIRTQYIIKQLIARTRWGNWVRVDMYVGLRLSCIEWRVSWRVTEQGSVRSLVIAFTFSKANKKYVSFNLYKRLIQNTHTQKKLQPEVKRRSKKNMSEQTWTIVTNDIEESISSLCVYQKHFSLHTKGYSTKHAHSTAKSNGKVIKCDLWCFGVVCISTSSTVRGLLCGYTILMRESKTGWCNVFRMLSAVHHRNGCCDNSNKSYPILANTYLFF